MKYWNVRDKKWWCVEYDAQELKRFSERWPTSGLRRYKKAIFCFDAKGDVANDPLPDFSGDAAAVVALVRSARTWLAHRGVRYGVFGADPAKQPPYLRDATWLGEIGDLAAPRGRKTPPRVRVYDNGGRSADRYTVVFDYGWGRRDTAYMSENASSPNGVNMTGQGLRYGEREDDLGRKLSAKEIGSLPSGVQRAIHERQFEEVR